MRCSNCGGENESGVNFCQYCGAKLEQESNFSQNDFDKGQAGQTGYDPNYSIKQNTAIKQIIVIMEDIQDRQDIIN